MLKPKRVLTAKEALEIISKPWATLNDIQLLACIGESKARKERKKLIESYPEDKKLFNELIPMVDVIKHFQIDIDYLKKVSK